MSFHCFHLTFREVIAIETTMGYLFSPFLEFGVHIITVQKKNIVSLLILSQIACCYHQICKEREVCVTFEHMITLTIQKVVCYSDWTLNKFSKHPPYKMLYHGDGSIFGTILTGFMMSETFFINSDVFLHLIFFSLSIFICFLVLWTSSGWLEILSSVDCVWNWL